MKQPHLCAHLDRIALATALLVSACADQRRGLLPGSSKAPSEIQQACAVADEKCARCHTIDRIVMLRGAGERRWQMTIDQMRLKPSSSISSSDAAVIFRCLRFLDEGCADCQQRR